MFRTIILCLLIAVSGWFRTGCATAYAANVMLTHEFSFTVISDLTIISVSPPKGATGVSRTQPLSVEFAHPLPVVSAQLSVTIGGTPVAGEQISVVTAEGRKIVWTPTNPYPMQAEVRWTLNVTVENEL